MKAMVLAAGLGTRLRPITDNRPKALVQIAGRTLLDLTLARLRAFGVSEVVVNTHHFAETIAAYLEDHHNFGMRIVVSHETTLLDTGGGLQHAAWFFMDSPDEPFVLHNVDVLSSIDLGKMVERHSASGALAMLAVRDRKTTRALLFDGDLNLRGRHGGSVEPEGLQPLAFSGIHVISPRLLPLLTAIYPPGVPYSIIDAYLELTRRGERIRAYRDDTSYWRDLGRIADLELAAKELDRL